MQNRAYASPLSNFLLLLFIIFSLFTVAYFLIQCIYFLDPNFITKFAGIIMEDIENQIGNLTDSDLNNFHARTHKGDLPLSVLNDDVFKPLGYEIAKPTRPVPTLKMLHEPTCEQTFIEWLKVLKQPQPTIPPLAIPIIEFDDFVMNDYSGVKSRYINSNTRNVTQRKNWDRIGELMSYTKSQLAKLEHGPEAVSMFNAMDGFSLQNKVGFVIGAMQPWIEVMALQHGVQKLLTAEKYPLNVQKEFEELILSVHPEVVAQNWKDYANKFDFGASYSVLQHVGLGRFGDPLDPIGDIREMLKAKCMLKKGGIFFLGLPYGVDSILYNSHRVYGSLRLAMMFTGFEWIASYSHERSSSFHLNYRTLNLHPLFESVHYTLVLRKL